MELVLRVLVVTVTVIVLGAVNADVIVQPGYGQSNYHQYSQRLPIHSPPQQYQQHPQQRPHYGYNVGDVRTSWAPNYYGYPWSPYRGLPGGRLISLGPLGLQTLRLGGLGGYGSPFLLRPNAQPYITGRNQFPAPIDDQFKSTSGHEGRDSGRSSRKSKDDVYDVASNSTIKHPNKLQGMARMKPSSNDKPVSLPKNNKSDYDVVGGSLLDPLGPTNQARGYLNDKLPTYYSQSSRPYETSIGNPQNQKNLKMQQQKPPGPSDKGNDKQKSPSSPDQHVEPPASSQISTQSQHEPLVEQHRMGYSDWQAPSRQRPLSDLTYIENQPNPTVPGGSYSQGMYWPNGEGTHVNLGNPAGDWKQMTSAPSPHGENRAIDWMHFPYTNEANPSYGHPEMGRADSLASRAMHQLLDTAERLVELESPDNNGNVGDAKPAKAEPTSKSAIMDPSNMAYGPDGRIDPQIYHDRGYSNSYPGYYRGYQPAPYYQPNLPYQGYSYQYPMRGLGYRPA